MSAEASTPTTAPWGTRAAISAVVFPFPQPTSRIRSLPLRSSSARTSSAIAACKVEIRAYSDAFHSVIPLHSRGARRQRQRSSRLNQDCGCVGGKYEPLGIAGDVFQAKYFFPDEQVVITQPNLLIGFSVDGVHNGFLSQEGAIGIRCSHQLLADFVAHIDDRSSLACRHQSSFSVAQFHSLFNLISPKRIQSYRQFFWRASSPERGSGCNGRSGSCQWQESGIGAYSTGRVDS